MEKLIKVKVDKLGNPEITTEGFAGDECTKATEGIEKALTDGKGVDRTYLPEYYQANRGQHVEQQLRRM